jgi:predicted RNase H-like HicB family nuclease
METLELKVHIYKDGEYYTAYCLDNGIATMGRTVAEAKRNIREALELYFEDDGVEVNKRPNREVHTFQLEYA